MMKFLNKKRKVLGNKGFSLVELIIVIAIMAVLMAVLAPQLIKYVEKSRVQADNTFMSELKNAVQLACSDDTIYSNLAETGDYVEWNANTGVITIDLANGTGEAEMITAVSDTIGGMSHTASSNTYKNADDPTYTIDILLEDGVVTLNEAFPVVDTP